LTKYWDGQPVTYVCQKRGTPGNDVMFAVGFEIVDEELKKALGDKGKGKGFKETESPAENLDQKANEKVEDKKEKVEISDDLD
jgi:methyl coenzyme M reductase gamma subunit